MKKIEKCPYCDKEIDLVKAENLNDYEDLFEFKCYYCDGWFDIPMSKDEFDEIVREKKETKV